MGLKIWGSGLADLFSRAGLALTSVLVDPESIAITSRFAIEVEGEDDEMLLYNWLSEILFLFDADGILLRQFDDLEFFEEGGNKKLRATLFGEQYSPPRHQVKTYVKAITLHQLKISETRSNAGLEARVYLDI
jgi:SHS2 domain-containing protein